MTPQPHTREPSRATWTDERMDDLAQGMRDGFTRVDSRFNHLESRIDSLRRTLIVGLFSLTATMIAALAALLVSL